MLLLAVANAVQNGIIGVDDSVTGAVIGAMTLFVANGIVMLLASRSQRFHNLVIGHSIELVVAGKVNKHVLKRQRISEQDLLAAATEQGATEIGDINHAVLAENGDIVVTLYAHLKLQDQIKALSDQVTALQSLVESKIIKKRTKRNVLAKTNKMTFGVEIRRWKHLINGHRFLRLKNYPIEPADLSS